MAKQGRRAGAFAFATALSVAAYHLSVFGVFFLVPLQWVRLRRDESSFLAASLLSAAGISAVAAGFKALSKSPWTVVDTAVLALPLLLIAGWVAIVVMERLGWRFLYRLLVVTAVTGLMLFPLIASLLSQDAFNRTVTQAFDELWVQVFQTPGLDQGLMGQLDKNEFFELMKQAFLGSFLLVFFLFWAFTGRVARAFELPARPWTLRDFVLPSQGAWVLLGLWGAILAQGLLVRAGVRWDWGFLQYAVLNVAWVALLTHALAGWGILHSLMDRWHWPRFVQAAARVSLILLLLVPGTGQMVVLVGLPILAVLELWVNFRTRTQGVGL